MSKMVILRGLPGSGKSTLAKQYCTRGYKRFNKDDLRRMLDTGAFSEANEWFVHQSMLALIEGALLKGYPVVVDNTHGKQKNVNELIELATDYSYEVEEVVLDTPVEKCIQRDALREQPCGEDVIRGMLARYPFFQALYQ